MTLKNTIISSIDIDEDEDILLQNISLINPNPPAKHRGWPKRHCRRSGYYHSILGLFNKLGKPTLDNDLHKSSPKSYEKNWFDYEIESFRKMQNILSELYNNRFVEYKKMIAEENGYILSPEELKSKTKFKLIPA